MRVFLNLVLLTYLALTLLNCDDQVVVDPNNCEMDANKFDVIVSYDEYFDTLFVTPYQHTNPNLKYNCTYLWNTGSTDFKIGNPSSRYYTVVVKGPAPLFCRTEKSFLVALPGTCNPSVTDSFGNTYPVVEAGGKCWMAANLICPGKATHVPEEIEWNDLHVNQSQQAAYSWYDNDNSILNKNFGLLYNWNAANSGRICPSGWHVATKNDWLALMDSVRTNGGALKSKSLQDWKLPNTGSESGYGFNVVGAGLRTELGEFLDKKYGTAFWTNEESGLNATAFALYYDSKHFSFMQLPKSTGLSCRCVKD